MSNTSDITFNFNLPHGINTDESVHSVQDKDDDAAAGLEHPNDNNNQLGLDRIADTGEELNYRQFSTGFSDDEGTGEAFERSWSKLQAEKQASTSAKGKKSPRRADNQESSSTSKGRRKKSRKSLLGGVNEDMSEEVQNDVLSARRPSGHSIGNRMSSLSLEQQTSGEDDMDQPMNNNFGLACSDVGSVCNSPVPSDDEIIIPPDDVAPYELRQNIDRKKAFTYVDTDKSGNWDPEHEAKERTLKLVRAKAAKKQKKERRKAKGKRNAPTDWVMKCIAKLQFEAFGNVRNITEDVQNWPDGWSDVDSDQERELQEYRGFHRKNTPGLEAQLPLEDPADKADDLTGHPVARGCKQCRKIEQACSMVKGDTYPCDRCVNNDSECHLIQQPTVKDRCKQCNEVDEQTCSLQDDPRQIICDRCADGDYICEAFPPEGYKAKRIDLDEIAYGSNRAYAACTACRTLKKKCSLKGKTDNPPCKYCTKNNLGCTFYDLPKHDAPKQTAKKKTLLEHIAPEFTKPSQEYFTPEDLADMSRRRIEVLPREPTPEIEMEDAEGHKGKLTKIRTSFAHPIQFNVRRGEGLECSFCNVPTFGMVGHFEREVHVIQWYSGLGYSEVGGGACSDYGQTIMCEDCTISRLQIMLCEGHVLEGLPDVCEDFDLVTDELMGTEADSPEMHYQLQRWCSLCFLPAWFGCSSVAPSLANGVSEVAGCGLRLCKPCEQTLRMDYDGDFARMVAAMDANPKISEADGLTQDIEGRVRADVGFLREDSLLVRNANLEG